MKTSPVLFGVHRDRWKEVHAELYRASTHILLLPADVTVCVGRFHVKPRYIIPIFINTIISSEHLHNLFV